MSAPMDGVHGLSPRRPTNHRALRTQLRRALLHRLEGGCQVPIAAYATLTQGEVQLEGLVASVDGKTVIRDAVRGGSAEAQALGTQLAERLLSRGADKILREIYGKA